MSARLKLKYTSASQSTALVFPPETDVCAVLDRIAAEFCRPDPEQDQRFEWLMHRLDAEAMAGKPAQLPSKNRKTLAR